VKEAAETVGRGTKKVVEKVGSKGKDVGKGGMGWMKSLKVRKVV